MLLVRWDTIEGDRALAVLSARATGAFALQDKGIKGGAVCFGGKIQILIRMIDKNLNNIIKILLMVSKQEK